MIDIENTIQELRERVIFFKQSIESDDLLRSKYFVIARTLYAISDILAQRPIDSKKLSGAALGIIKILDGPLHNPLEEKLFDLAGDIGLLIQELKQNTGRNKR